MTFNARSKSNLTRKKNICTKEMLLLRLGTSFLCLYLYFLPFCSAIEQDLECFDRDTCSNSSLKSPSIYDDEIYVQSRNCFCDSLCQQYGDCCEQPTRINSNRYECTDFLSPTFNNRTPLFSPLSVWMRTTCLPIYVGTSIDSQCRNLQDETFADEPLLFIPVTSQRTNITYRNYFCAFCNNDAHEDILSWEYRAFCHGNGTIFDHMMLSEQEHVNYYVHNLTRDCTKTIRYPTRFGTSEPSIYIRPCKKTLPAHCPSRTPLNLARNCSQSPPAYRYDKLTKLVYHNSFCAQCQQIDFDQITCFDPIRSSGILTFQHIRNYPLSILFDPNLLKRYLNIHRQSNSTTGMFYSLASTCTKSKEIYNLFLKKCQPITHSNHLPKCSNPILTLNNYQRFDNGSIFLENELILLTHDQYALIDDHHLVFCTDLWKPLSTSSPKFPLFRSIISIICTVISLFCLLLFMISFCLISSLHNFPGKCLLFLSICLFIGQLTFISTSDLTHYTSFCFISGILIHYFYLSSFFWLLIIALHIHSAFTQQNKILHKEHHQFHLYIFNILVWCSTGIIIFIGCLVQFIQPESTFSPNYGFLFCSISNGNAMIIFFLVPIGCSLLIVMFLFVKTILAIYRTHQIARLASSSTTTTTTTTNNSHDQNLVYIYLRLASLMGLQWCLLIFALIIRRAWSWIIFEIVNSLPGVFICFGFLFSQRLWIGIKQRITLQLINRRQSSRSQTTSTSLMSPINQK